MERACDVCGERYEALRSTSKVCSKRCRVRKTRARAATGRAPESVPAVAGAGVDGGELDGPLLASTRVELEQAGRVGTALGQAALLAARRLDAAAREPGMGMAAMLREHRAALAEALRGAARAEDLVDELQERRARRRGA